MKTSKLFIVFLVAMAIMGGISYAQYVADTVLQQKINNDINTISHDLAEVAAANADIQNIIGDNSASAVTSQVPDVQAIQAAQQVSGAQLSQQANVIQ